MSISPGTIHASGPPTACAGASRASPTATTRPSSTVRSRTPRSSGASTRPTSESAAGGSFIVATVGATLGRMTKIGYACMLEQFHPTELLDWAELAEASGFDAGFQVSEHFHPWTPQQGQAAFAWSFMGALGQRTRLPFGTAVTCPGFRYHPAVIAHAAATLGAMYPGRFWLGLGAGEALNEHVIGGEWPEVGERSRMMFESIEIITKLFSGKVVKHDGEYFTLESAKLYTRPEQPVPIYVATAGPVNAKKTGKFADGIITVGAADEKIGMIRDKFAEGAREVGKDPSSAPMLLQIHISWAPTDEGATQNALVEWPNGG